MFDWLRDWIDVHVWAEVAKNIAPWIRFYTQIGGHCGICGKWVPNVLVERNWAWTLCEKCAKGGKD